MKGEQSWQKRHGKEDIYQAEGPGKVVKLAGCEDGSLTGYDLDSLGLNSVTLFMRKTEIF